MFSESTCSGVSKISKLFYSRSFGLTSPSARDVAQWWLMIAKMDYRNKTHLFWYNNLTILKVGAEQILILYYSNSWLARTSPSPQCLSVVFPKGGQIFLWKKVLTSAKTRVGAAARSMASYYIDQAAADPGQQHNCWGEHFVMAGSTTYYIHSGPDTL
jgi:hypothetical protein